MEVGCWIKWYVIVSFANPLGARSFLLELFKWDMCLRLYLCLIPIILQSHHNLLLFLFWCHFRFFKILSPFDFTEPQNGWPGASRCSDKMLCPGMLGNLPPLDHPPSHLTLFNLPSPSLPSLPSSSPTILPGCLRRPHHHHLYFWSAHWQCEPGGQGREHPSLLPPRPHSLGLEPGTSPLLPPHPPHLLLPSLPPSPPPCFQLGRQADLQLLEKRGIFLASVERRGRLQVVLLDSLAQFCSCLLKNPGGTLSASGQFWTQGSAGISSTLDSSASTRWFGILSKPTFVESTV